MNFFIDKSSHMPLYIQLKDAFSEKIRNGSLPYGSKLPSENELVELLGLSRMTVRSAMLALANENYVEKHHGKGTFVCYKSKQPVLGHINVLLDVTYAYFSTHYIKSISAILTQNDYHFIIHDTQDNQEKICDTLERILQSDCSGILLQPSRWVEPWSDRLKDLIRTIQVQGIPCVLLDRSIEGVSLPCVQFNDYGGARIAAEHLVQLGHRRCAMVCCSNFCENATRYAGFNSVLQEHGYPTLFTVEKDNQLEENLIDAVQKNNITAIFCYNDEVAVKVFHHLAAAGYHIPTDISVIGFDDTVLTQATSPQMTSVIHPKEHLGLASANLLIGILEHQDYVIPMQSLRPKLCVRESTNFVNAGGLYENNSNV